MGNKVKIVVKGALIYFIITNCVAGGVALYGIYKEVLYKLADKCHTKKRARET